MLWLILTFHVLGAAIWTGGHLVLATTVLPRALKARDPGILLRFEQGFERIGMPALLVQVATGLWLASQVSDPMGWLSFADRLPRGRGGKALPVGGDGPVGPERKIPGNPDTPRRNPALMGWHIRAVTLFAVLFVMAGGVWIRTGGF